MLGPYSTISCIVGAEHASARNLEAKRRSTFDQV